MHKTSSIEECFTSIYKDIENKYPKTKDNESENLRVRCFEFLCLQHTPTLKKYNIRKETSLTEDWFKRMKKGKKTSLVNCIIFALYTINSYDEVIEFLFINEHYLFSCSSDVMKRVYLDGIRRVYEQEIEDGRKRCSYMNEFLEMNNFQKLI